MAQEEMMAPETTMPEQNDQQVSQQDMMADQMIDELEDARRQMSIEYAQFFNEMNWLKAISPNLEFKPFVKEDK
jgi:hypothetical protein